METGARGYGPVIALRALRAPGRQYSVKAPLDSLAASFLLELLVYPAVYLLWRKRELRRGPA